MNTCDIFQFFQTLSKVVFFQAHLWHICDNSMTDHSLHTLKYRTHVGVMVKKDGAIIICSLLLYSIIFLFKLVYMLLFLLYIIFLSMFYLALKVSWNTLCGGNRRDYVLSGILNPYFNI